MSSRRGAVRLIWARHGENIANLTGTFSHAVFDGDLTDRGRQQAEELGHRLAKAPGGAVGFVAVSPLRRAVHTGDIVGRRLGLEPQLVLEALRELAVGDLDGRNNPAAWRTYESVLEAWRCGDAQARFPSAGDRDPARRVLATLPHPTTPPT